MQGGAVSWKGSRPFFEDNSFFGNSARYGSDIASFAITLALTSESPSSISDCASGQSANTTLTLELLDHYRQRVTSDNSSFASLTSPNTSTSFAGTTQVVAALGMFSFDSFSIISSPGFSTFINATSTALHSSESVSVEVYMRNCVLGEAKINEQCVPCSFGTYSLSANSSCKSCPAEAHCYRNYWISPRAGYWRASNSTELFLACPYAAACLESATVLSTAGQCSTGYEGNMCQTCSVGYFRWSRVRCSKCPNSALRTVGQLFVWIAVFLLVFLLLKLCSRASSTSLSFLYIKIFLNYLQLVMLFDSFNLAWPDLMLELFNAHEAVGGFPEFLFSFHCLYDDETELQRYERKMIVLSCLQLSLISISTVIWGIVSLRRRSLQYLKTEAVGSGLVLFFIALPSVVRAMLGVLHCRELLPGQFWVVGLDLRCWTPTHLKYVLGLATPCLVLWGVAVPVLTFLVIYRQRSLTESTNHQVRFGFLTSGFRGRCFYWEYAIIYRKFLIIAFTVFFAQTSIFLQALSTLGILLVSVTLQSLLRPYSQSALNSLEMRSLVVTTLTLYSGLFFYHESLGEVGEILLFSFIAVLNLAFTLLCLGYLGLRLVGKLTRKPKVLPTK